MKTFKKLYPNIISFENLEAAWRKARKGKRNKLAVIRFEANAEGELLQLQRELQSQTYQPAAFATKCASFFVSV